MTMRRVLVTGGAGFIGSHLVDALLAEGCHVTAADNFDPFYPPAVKRAQIAAHLAHPAYTLVEVDIADAEAARTRIEGTFDVIVHLAAKAGVRPSIADPLAYQHANVTGTQNLLELARERRVPTFVFASSSSVYGVNPRVPWREDDHVLQPISPYASTKVSGELLGHVYAHLYGIRFLALRFFTVYGPRQRPDLAIHAFARRMLAGTPVPLFGDGSTRRDYTFIDDIVSGIRRAIDYEGSRYEVVNLGNNRTVSLQEMVETLGRRLGVRPLVEHHPEQPGDVPRTWADIDKARRLLGYAPSTPFEEGIGRFVAWLREAG
jgi:UDP-glucuronate 4-epimerase